ncbi:hypothetical protein C6I20_02840 [Aeromicrobium sp. A1-2]|uniref:PD-(D/E)XK nuclease family protein n=1 Tax=Aeromicrobium sp. A1-2 TaxID=2107713 RepID=UPI000E4907FF|nr:PD-(D/E)XK nuclease family protein [Aeromicrobium sp. A1-2]AXT84232.1 hypothetical protein C6I20_02840 [Aeromicrobium sp. A1-2]
MRDQLLTDLVRLLGISAEEQFNVFDVMHHGTHEKQLSNVFAWLLNSNGTHQLGDAFQRIFIAEMNRSRPDLEAVPAGTYGVRQEVNTSASNEGMDIADIVLEDHATTIVIENYYTSSGHGHGYERYLHFGARAGKRSVVVMLCEHEDRNLLTDGWDEALVVSYASVFAGLARHVEDDKKFKAQFPQQCLFFDHMQRRFVKGRKVNDDSLLEFVDAMCTAGEAQLYGRRPVEDAAIVFADQILDAAIDRFNESRDVLARVKKRLRDYGQAALLPQLNDSFGEGYVNLVSARYAGIYQWTINFYGSDATGNVASRVQLKFGPSAWHANENDDEWRKTVPAADADYSRLFLTCRREIRQSTVSIRDVLEGIDSGDTRLSNELVEFITAGNSNEVSPDEGLVTD